MDVPKRIVPPWFFVVVLALTGVPVVMSFLGRFGWLQASPNTIAPEALDGTVRALHGLLIHTVLQWTGVCIALFTAVCAFAQFTLRRDLAMTIIGAALLLAGCMDAFQTLAATRLLGTVADDVQFIPFTWSLSRMFHAGVVAFGAAAFAFGAPVGPRLGRMKSSVLLGGAFICVGGAYLLIRLCREWDPLPVALAPDSPVVRPWDGVALMIYLLAGGIVLPRFFRRHPSLFAYGLLLSLIPHILGQTYAAFVARNEFGVAFLTAQGLKLVGYSVPLTGLLIDYLRAQQAAAELSETRAGLRVARELQVGLLPTEAPKVSGLAIESISTSAETVGGDWFDYLKLADGSWGVVIGDVSGHEVGAALVMTQTRAYLRAAAGAAVDPGVLLTRVNEFLIKDVRDRRFVGLFVAVLKHDGLIEYAAAGLTAVVFNADGVIRELPATGPVLGVDATPIPCGGAFTLNSQEALLLATDGWEEARNLNGEFFGQLRMIETLRSQMTEPSAHRLQQMHAAVKQFCLPRPPQDDLTAVLIQRM